MRLTASLTSVLPDVDIVVDATLNESKRFSSSKVAFDVVLFEVWKSFGINPPTDPYFELLLGGGAKKVRNLRKKRKCVVLILPVGQQKSIFLVLLITKEKIKKISYLI